jgi:hypothetical protein
MSLPLGRLTERHWARGWIVQILSFSAATMAYLPARKLAIAISVTVTELDELALVDRLPLRGWLVSWLDMRLSRSIPTLVPRGRVWRTRPGARLRWVRGHRPIPRRGYVLGQRPRSRW